MPTWSAGLDVNTRSPGCSALIGISGWNMLYCAPEKCGSDTPACAQAIIVSPEQSKQVGPVPPVQYDLLIWASAYATAAPARPLGGGSWVTSAGGPLWLSCWVLAAATSGTSGPCTCAFSAASWPT